MRRKEARIIILGTFSGAAAQAICKEYLKKHPEFLDEQPLENKEVKPRNLGLSKVFRNLYRGGVASKIAYMRAILTRGGGSYNITKSISSSSLKDFAIIGWTCFGVGLIGFTILGSLYLFQRAERKRRHNQNDEVLIDGIVSLSKSQ